MNGSASASPTIPRESGSLVRAYTGPATTVACICVPSVTATRLATYQRKSGFRSETYGSCRSVIPSGDEISGIQMIGTPDQLGNLGWRAATDRILFVAVNANPRRRQNASGGDQEAGEGRVSPLLREIHRSRGKW